jgi:hypothetical protein
MNQLPHVVALIEPWLGWRFALTRNPERACQEIVRFFKRARSKILAGHAVFSHRVYGEVPTNTIEERRREGSLRRSQARLGRIRLPKEVAPDFRLVVKHVGVFTAQLGRSARSLFAEPAGEAALLVDPHSVEEIAAAMWRVIEDQTLRAHLREQGIDRARTFSWERTATEHVRVFQSVLTGGSSSPCRSPERLPVRVFRYRVPDLRGHMPNSCI